MLGQISPNMVRIQQRNSYDSESLCLISNRRILSAFSLLSSLPYFLHITLCHVVTITTICPILFSLCYCVFGKERYPVSLTTRKANTWITNYIQVWSPRSDVPRSHKIHPMSKLSLLSKHNKCFSYEKSTEWTHIGPRKLCIFSETRKHAREFYRSISRHHPWVFLCAGILHGRKITGSGHNSHCDGHAGTFLEFVNGVLKGVLNN